MAGVGSDGFKNGEGVWRKWVDGAYYPAKIVDADADPKTPGVVCLTRWGRESEKAEFPPDEEVPAESLAPWHPASMAPGDGHCTE